MNILKNRHKRKENKEKGMNEHMNKFAETDRKRQTQMNIQKDRHEKKEKRKGNEWTNLDRQTERDSYRGTY